MSRTLQALRPQAGFTLVEILVVVVIIGIMLSFATLSVSGRAAADKLDTEAQRLEQLFRLAQEEAELKGYEMGFRYTDTLYQFLVVGPEKQWMPVAEGPLRTRPIPPPLELSLRVEDRPVPPAQEATERGGDTPSPLVPQVLILSSGELTAFTLDLAAAGVEAGYRLSGSLMGRIDLERRDPDALR